VPFSDAPEWAFPEKDGRQVVITGAVSKLFSGVLQKIFGSQVACFAAPPRHQKMN
jgi:hypothetical protein